MKKRVLSIVLALALCLSMLPAAAWAAGNTIYVSSGGNDSYNGTTKEQAVKTIERALQLATDGDTIHIVDAADTQQLSLDVPLFISKGVTITGGELTLRRGGIILGANVTFRNVKLNFISAVRNAIIANGYALTLESVQKTGTYNVDLFCGTITGYTHADMPAAGSAGAIAISGTDNRLGDIFAGSFAEPIATLMEGTTDKYHSDAGAQNDWSGTSTITLSPGVGGTIGTILACGATERRGIGSGIMIPYPMPGTDGDYPGTGKQDADRYIVSGNVTINLTNLANTTVYGATGGSTNATVTFTDNGNGYSFSPTLYNVGALRLNNSGAHLAPAADSTIDPTAAVSVPDGARLDLANLINSPSDDPFAEAPPFTIGSLSGGGTLVLGQGQTLTITGAVTGDTGVAIGNLTSVDNEDKTTTEFAEDVTYITTGTGVSGGFTALSDTMVLTMDDQGGWKAGDKNAVPVTVTSFALPQTVASGAEFAEIPVTAEYANGNDNTSMSIFPVTITVNDEPAGWNETEQAYLVEAHGQNLALSFTYTDQEVLYVQHVDENATLPAGTYEISVTVPADSTTRGQPITSTATLTVGTGGSTPLTSLAGAVVTAVEQTYTGSALTPGLTVKLNDTPLAAGTDYTITGYADNTNAGTASVTIQGTGNYTGEATGTFTISPKDIAGATVGGFASMTYTGSALTPSAQVTLAHYANPVTGAWSAVTNVSDTTTFTANGNFTGALTGQNPGMQKKPVTVTAGSRTIQTTEGVPEASTLGYTPSGLVDGHSVTTPPALSYATQPAEGTEGEHLVNVETGGMVISDGQTDVTANYDITPVSGKLTITAEKAGAAVDTAPEARAELSYNGQAQPLVTAGTAAGGTMQYALGESAPADDSGWSETIPTGTGAGDYTLWYRVKGDSGHTNSQPGSLKVSIGKAPLTIAAADQVIPIGGELDQTKYLVTGLMGGHTVSGVTLTASGGAITPSGGTVSGGGADVSANYAISYVGGTLTATEKTIVTITAGIPTLTYDGTDQRGKITATAKDGGTVVNGLTYTYDFSAAPINAGEYTVTIRVADTDTRYVGTLTTAFTIGKRTLTLTADNKSATLGGTPPAYSYTAGGQGLATGDSIITAPTLSCVPNMAAAGSYPITIDVSGVKIGRGGVDATASYTITGAGGTLTVSGSGGGGYVPPYTPPYTPPYVPPYTPPYTPGTPSTPAAPGTPPAQSVTVPISGDGSAIHVGASISGDKATVRMVDLSHLNTVIGDHVEEVGTVTIDFSGLNRTITTVELPAGVVKQIADAVNNPGNDAHSFELVLPGGASIEFDAAAMEEKTAQANGTDITISIRSSGDFRPNAAQSAALRGRPAYDITVTSGGRRISDMGGSVTIHAPYELRSGEQPRGVVVWYVDEMGGRERCQTSYDSVTRRVNWKTDHLSLYMIDYDPAVAGSCDGGARCPSAGLIDVAPNAWYHEAVDYAMGKGLMGGYGNGRFGPNDVTSRAQLVTILWRLAGEPMVSGFTRFEDVPEGRWYTEAVRWAAGGKLVEGWNGRFSPDDPITREQLAAILWRYAGSPPATRKELDFSDADKVSGWALDAMTWARENGIMAGDNGAVDPQGSATRAHAAQMLLRFIEGVITGGQAAK